ncbi:MAG TPA: metalloprotease TldD [Chromatiaceae bacterium]|nr:metalloprotease TldD [Chromatiaceae bacterium]
MKTQVLDIARSTLLEPVGLAQAHLNRLIDGVLGSQVDFADAYFESARSESWVLEDGIVREGNYNIDQGCGIRAISGEKTGFAYTDDIRLENLLEAAHSARAIASLGQNRQVRIGDGTAVAPLYAPSNPLVSLDARQKIDLLKRADATARGADPRVKQVNVNLVAAYDVVLVVNSEGLLSADVRPLVRMSTSVIVEQDGRREQGYAGGGARTTLDYFIDESRAEQYAREAVRQALVNLEAVAAPAGAMPVVLGPGWPGVLLHEAVGHGLEGDFNRKGTSAFAGRIGEQVASKLCSVVDDGTLPGRRGSLSMDDEGTPSENTVLIENGILKGYMQDKMNAGLMGQAPTGNGRRESYAHLPMPRMTNTYMLAGEHKPEEIIASVEKGLYAVNFGGGQVDITSGKFVFSLNEAYLIENGKVTAPVKGATLIGNGPEVMTRISMVGDDLALDSGIGVCGKEGQSVPVGVGQPTLKVDEITVGGTAA